MEGIFVMPESRMPFTPVFESSNARICAFLKSLTDSNAIVLEWKVAKQKGVIKSNY
jgi:hypothetical protein